jgi:hypothetical protein
LRFKLILFYFGGTFSLASHKINDGKNVNGEGVEIGRGGKRKAFSCSIFFVTAVKKCNVLNIDDKKELNRS